jgi:hypothetical protein
MFFSSELDFAEETPKSPSLEETIPDLAIIILAVWGWILAMRIWTNPSSCHYIPDAA